MHCYVPICTINLKFVANLLQNCFFVAKSVNPLSGLFPRKSLNSLIDSPVNEICSASPFSGAITEEEIYPTLPDGLNGALDSSRIKTYLKYSLYPLMHLFGKNSMPDVDNLLTSFYQLDDEARKEVVETIQFKLQYHKDAERAEQVKQIKGW